jgi:TolB protein
LSEFTVPLIAVIPFAGGDGLLDVAQVIETDLQRTGVLGTLQRSGLPARPAAAKQLDFQEWAHAGVANVVIGSITRADTGRFGVKIDLFNVLQREHVLGFEIPPVEPARMREAAHQASDRIIGKLTTTPGLSSTKIAYVSANGVGAERRNALMVADIDGQNARVVAASREPIMSPAWSPDGSRIAFVGFEQGQPAIFVQEIATGRQTRLIAEKGINASPAWSPDGTRIALTLQIDPQNPDICIVDVASGSRRRITQTPGVDTEPAWSPDGASLLFTSERGGQPQIYRVAAAGGDAVLVSRTGKQNLRASYSPDGRNIAMVNRDDGRFRIGVLEVATDAFRLVTDGRLDMSPTWAPNGQAIAYSTRGPSGEELALVRIDGRAMPKIALIGEAREPAWSPMQR